MSACVSLLVLHLIWKGTGVHPYQLGRDSQTCGVKHDGHPRIDPSAITLPHSTWDRQVTVLEAPIQ